MDGLIASIGHNLRRLFDFSGRDSRARFWPYAILLFLLSIAAGVAAVIPVMMDMFARIQRYMIEHQKPVEGVWPDSDEFPPELMPDMSVIVIPMAVINLLLLLLLAAAVVRRLHDRDRSGWWALLPVPFTIYGQFQGMESAEMMMGSAPADPAIMLSALNSLFYWIALIALIVILVQPGTSGENRHGPEPAA